ncbi:MAG: MBOAT family protein, partial [Planctomycetaceae bacterium]
MLFNSLTFLIFFALVLLLHRLPVSWRTKKIQLVVASYLFYAAWNPPFVLLLAVSTLVAWIAARRIASSNSPAKRRLFLVISLCVDLGMLGYFKYATFAVENFARLLHAFGVAYDPPEWDIVLPVGISFYTFHTLSYTIDVYRRRFSPWPSFVDFALYVSFFPQLVAGPITRAAQFLPQLVAPRRATRAEFVWGIDLVIIGLFLKIVLADRIFRPVVDAVYSVAVSPNVASAWSGMLAFCGQIYCDFAGYSTCAVGAALCLGFALPDNFRRPLAPIGFIDFWQRWHISLSSWLRDYVYVSLGGNRHGPVRSAANMMLTMLLAGLWHGASWTYIAFGGLNGIALLGEVGVRRTRLAQSPFWGGTIPRIAIAAGTLLLLGWTCVFFRAQSIAQAFAVSNALVGMVSSAAASSVKDSQAFLALMLIEVLFFVHFLMRDVSIEELAARVPGWLWSVLLASMLVAILLMPG